ncbi:SGNH/GDSL hydrolase family protein [Mariniphaga sp.]|uniref:SGNH/GDSL hydrolase family protein n=1 Tax=Mariniphaga sp. TaxID=1954475 RepID=UPI0035661581
MATRRDFLQKTLMFSPLVVWPNSLVTFFQNDLPNVLILGDSISIGYTPFVQEYLKGRANVFRPMLENGKPENCAGTTKGVENIDRWLGDKKWDIIHFNFGLHDIKHVDPVTGENSQNPKHPQQANRKQYKKNLEIIVEKLKATGAKLIFATTTPYPETVEGPLRKPGMPQKYNRAAVKIMNKNGILINNLHAFMVPRMADLQLPNNVHFTEDGSREMAKKVVERINEVFEEINNS